MTSHSTPPPPPRRILSLPAVPPCESISPSTLLSSLLSLAADISTPTGPTRYPTQRRAVREALRHVAILSSFFSDITNSDIPNSAVLGLSELHVTLQRLAHLLRDCSRRGARLWVLMNSARVVSDFRALLRSVAVSLDVLPLNSLTSNNEVRDMVSLLATQAWKANPKPDPADERAVETVRSALARFANGAHPDAAELKSLLHRLQIRSWSDCGDEIAFLEEQLMDYSTVEPDGESVLLANLTSLLVYCRATMFKVNRIEEARRRETREDDDQQRIRGLNPESFRCPISLEIMAEPVTISTGQTYDRASIVRWLKNGYLTCPVTGEKLRTAEFVPNSALQSIIHQYCPQFSGGGGSRKRDIAVTSSPISSAAAGATRMAVNFLVGRLHAGSDGEKNRAAHEIRLLSKSSIFNRACFVEADCVPWLLHLLSTSDASIQDNAVAALLNLSKHPSGRTAIFDVGGVSLIVDAMSDGLKAEAKQNAAAILFYLSSVEEYRKEIGEIPGAIPALVNLLRRGSYRGKKNAVVALFGLLLSPGNQLKVIAAGATRALIDLLADEREDLVNDCVGVLAKIAERQEGADAILRASPDVLQSLVDVLHSSTSRSGREYCVSIMLSLCNHGGAKVVGLLEKMPLLMPALYSVVAGGSPQASKKARSLVNYIHKIHDQDFPSTAPPPQPPTSQDRVVHAR